MSERRVQSYCFGCKTYLCLKVPDKNEMKDGSKYKSSPDYVSLKNDQNSNVILENNCWIMHHSDGISSYFDEKKKSSDD